MFAHRQAIWGAAVALTAAGAWLMQALADAQVGSDFQPNEAVQSIRVELTVAPGGEDLDEPLALDLGLGFPLWLHQLGRVDNAPAPFGAVSQRGTAAHAIRAGERATFEFSTTAGGPLDTLLTTPQLLAGVQISDISRVGITSPGEHGWILAGYAVHINGKLLVANDAANMNGRGRQDEARERLTELNRDLEPQLTELADLRALVAAGLATAADRSRLAELEPALASRQAEQRRLERQLRGAAPLFVESGFQPAWRRSGALARVKVTVVTAPHSGAESRNYVYFRTGGHKYLLGSPARPLAPERGPQEFDLDLALAPLVAGDLRGYALGMLAHTEPSGDAPDRWHPQRLRVEVDDRVVYDSEDNPLDRNSLSAIRLIPPAQRRADGQVVANTPVAREALVWEAGSGAGLDLVNGGAEALPPPDDPNYPEAEPTLIVEQQVHVGGAQVDVGQQQIDTWYDPVADPFPGEVGFGPGWEPGWGPWPDGGYWPGWVPEWGPGGWDPGWGPGWVPPPTWLDLLMLGLLEHLGVLPDWVIPDPVGEPPQLETVQVDYATHTIHWTVTGNASQVDHFLIDHVLLRPDLAVPIVEAIGDPIEVAADQRSAPLPMGAIMLAGTPDELTRSYLAVRVTMVPTDPAVGVDPGLAPAAPVRPMVVAPHLNVMPDADFVPAGGPPGHLPVGFGGQPELPGPAAWLAGELATQNGLVFAGLSPHQHHVVARAQHDGDEMTVACAGFLLPGTYRFIALVGFQGAVEHHVAAHVHANVRLTSVLNPALPPADFGGDAAAEADPALPPAPLVPLIIDVNTAGVGAGPMAFRVTFRFVQIDVDPQHPPVLVGLRLLGM